MTNLPDLMDAVEQQPMDDANVDANEQIISQISTEIVYETQNHSTESIETVSAFDSGTDDATNAMGESEKPLIEEVMEASQQEPNVSVVDSQEIFLNPDDLKDQNVLFIDVSGTENATQEAVSHIEQQHDAAETVDLDKDIKVTFHKQVVSNVNTPTSFPSEEIQRATRYLCPVCQKSFRQRHLLLCHIKLHDQKPKSNNVYMSNCTSCGGHVRLTSEQARLLQERGTSDARIICSTCKLLGHDIMQPMGSTKVSAPTPINKTQPSPFYCDMCNCDIKLTDDQLQLVEKKGAENIRIICSPCSLKEQENQAAGGDSQAQDGLKCRSCLRPIEIQGNRNGVDPICVDCQSKTESELAVENMNAGESRIFPSHCSFCNKEVYLSEQPQANAEIKCSDCKTKKQQPFAVRKFKTISPVKRPTVKGLSVMYKCNICYCSMHLSEEQKLLLKARGVSGTKIICSSCHKNEKAKPTKMKRVRKLRTYQCDVCLGDMDMDYIPTAGDDIVCATCRKVEEMEREKQSTASAVKRTILKCCGCQKPLSVTPLTRKRLQEKGVVKLKCETCRRKPDVDESSTPARKVFKSSSEGVNYRCDVCAISFGDDFDKFSEHFTSVHVPTSDADSAKGADKSRKLPLIQCPICDASFMDRSNLKMHLNSHKSELSHVKQSLKKNCPFCHLCLTKTPMFDHYSETHHIQISKTVHNFDNADEFKMWKEELENATKARFVPRSDQAKNIRAMKRISVALHCQHDCPDGSRRSRKIGFFCPSRIDVYEHDGGLKAEFTETHVGHCDLSDFTLKEKDSISQLLKDDKTVEQVVFELVSQVASDAPEVKKYRRLLSYDRHSIKSELEGILQKEKVKSSLLIGNDDEESDVSYTSGSDVEGEYVPYPNALAWLLDDMQNEKNVSLNNAIVVARKTADSTLRFDYRTTAVKKLSTTADALTNKKMEMLRRITELVDKCLVEEHLDIMDVYLSPCEQTLNELCSGKRVVVVDDDSNDVNETTSNYDEAQAEEDDDVKPIPPQKRRKS
ncbi:Zinc finger protein [Nesidiocoris tenuis]|uniref:Zinc finger protein n=1 Tax=Nesidiocoris tenuis TaxID=355587 RepID=A0ABN7AV61_9HEMI|nr:Zinc finger protein [Nesidiocoris tenuis]